MTNEELKALFLWRAPSYMKHLPKFYQNVEDMRGIAAAVDPEFETLALDIRKDFVEGYILEAPAKHLSIWEKEIGIRANPIAEDEEFRRKRLIQRYTTKPPFTIRWLRQKLEQFLGNGLIKVERDEDIESLFIYMDISSLAMLEELILWLEMVVPLSMGFGCIYIGVREIPSRLFVSAHSPMWIQLEVKPA